MIEKPIYILGFMASGKSALGAKLARRLGVDFIDLDQAIEEREGKTISAIFQEKGEKHFRKLESEVLAEISQRKAVVALGGGTPCSEHNLSIIKNSGNSFYLKVKSEILIGRLKRQKHKRPLVAQLDGAELSEFVKAKIRERESYYLQADYVIEKDNPVPNDLIKPLENA